MSTTLALQSPVGSEKKNTINISVAEVFNSKLTSYSSRYWLEWRSCEPGQTPPFGQVLKVKIGEVKRERYSLLRMRNDLSK